MTKREKVLLQKHLNPKKAYFEINKGHWEITFWQLHKVCAFPIELNKNRLCRKQR